MEIGRSLNVSIIFPRGGTIEEPHCIFFYRFRKVAGFAGFFIFSLLFMMKRFHVGRHIFLVFKKQHISMQVCDAIS